MAQNLGAPTMGINSLDRSSTRMVELSPFLESRLEIPPKRVTNPLSTLASPNNLFEEAIWDLYRTGSTAALLPRAEDPLPASDNVLTPEDDPTPPPRIIRPDPDREDESRADP